MVFHRVTTVKINLILTTVGQSGYLFPNRTSLIYSEWTLSPFLNTELLHNGLSNWAIVTSLKYFWLQPWSTSLSLIVISRFPAQHLLTSPFVSPLLWPKFPFHSSCFIAYVSATVVLPANIHLSLKTCIVEPKI